MPRAPWRRRLVTDSPRPAGRKRWTGRFRRSRVMARRVLSVRHRGQVEPYRGHSSRPSRLDPRTTGSTIAAIPAAAGPPPSLAPPHPARAAAQPAPVRLLPGERTPARRFWFAVVNACTLASLSLGPLAILLAMGGELRTAAFCLVACVLFDGLDGALARRVGVASPFGSQLDSLADLCAFGIAAPVVVYAAAVPERSGGAGDAAGLAAAGLPAPAAAAACALVAGCAAIRLARFNIAPKDSRYFCGVPTTMAAAVLALAVLLDLPLPPAGLLAGLVLLGFAMVSSFPYPTLARLLRLPPWLWLLPLAGTLVDRRLTFLALVAAYLASGPALWLHRRRTAVA